MREDLEPGNYTFEYVYTDRTGNSASCYWQVRVYAPYEDPDATVFTVLYYIEDDNGGGGTRLRRRAVLAGADTGDTPPSFAEQQPQHALRQLLQQAVTPDPRSQGLTLRYVVSATYPWVPIDIPTFFSTNGTGFDADSTGTVGVTFVDSLNCDAANRTYVDPEASGGAVTDWKANEGVCFKTYEVTKADVDCSLAEETITIKHDMECSPAATDHHHHDIADSALSATAQTGCTDYNKPKQVTVVVAAQDFCQLDITTVETTATLYLGSEGWMDAILGGGSTQLNDVIGTYYGGHHPNEIAGEDTIVITGSSDSEVLAVCGVLVVQVDSPEQGSVQFDDLQLSSISYNGTSVQNPTGDSEHRNPAYTNLVGFCNNHSLPALASNVGDNGQYGISVTVEGAVDYSIDGLGSSRRRIQGGRRAVLYDESADFQVSEVYSFTATRGADDDPFFTPNTEGTTESGQGSGQGSELAWALPLGIGLLFLLCLCTGCSFMGYKTCVWAKDFALQQNPGFGKGKSPGSFHENVFPQKELEKMELPFPDTHFLARAEDFSGGSAGSHDRSAFVDDHGEQSEMTPIVSSANF